ncbi:MAG: hypothetical protein JNJ57_17180 [Saprospiraceae bacterium]|nr:hypothetical protein [Saprospiraceae bacterium]
MQNKLKIKRQNNAQLKEMFLQTTGYPKQRFSKNILKKIPKKFGGYKFPPATLQQFFINRVL